MRESGRAKYTCSKMQLDCGTPLANCRLVTPSSVTITSSPGCTSRMNSARSRSKAQLSLANTIVSGPSGFTIRAMESGRNPRGSRAAKIRSRVIITIENAPSTCASESAIASTSVAAFECAISCTIISESDVVWKYAPSRSSRARRLPRFTRFPLCAIAINPLVESTRIGCAFSSAESPVVEYRVCPMAIGPGSFSSTSSVKISETSPMPLMLARCCPSAVAIPADSCPRCCSAYSARYACRAASGCPWMATTPHSSRSFGSSSTAAAAMSIPRSSAARRCSS